MEKKTELSLEDLPLKIFVYKDYLITIASDDEFLKTGFRIAKSIAGRFPIPVPMIGITPEAKQFIINKAKEDSDKPGLFELIDLGGDMLFGDTSYEVMIVQYFGCDVFPPNIYKIYDENLEMLDRMRSITLDLLHEEFIIALDNSLRKRKLEFLAKMN